MDVKKAIDAINVNIDGVAEPVAKTSILFKKTKNLKKRIRDYAVKTID